MTQSIIGDRSTARRALDIFTAAKLDDSWPEKTPPDGWTRIGAGCSRTAYLAPDGVIYKVGRPEDNSNEAMAYAILGMLEHLMFAVPKVQEYEFAPSELGSRFDGYPYTLNCSNYSVVAAEFVKGDYSSDLDEMENYCEACNCGCSYVTGTYDETAKCSCGDCTCGEGLAGAAERFFQTSDLHERNVKFWNGKYYCIDLGGFCC